MLSRHPERLWTFAGPDDIDALDVAGEMVILGFQSTVRALDAATGAPRWRFEATLDGGGSFFDAVSLSVDSGTVFVSTGGSVVALDAATGHRRWSAPMDIPDAYARRLGVQVTAATGSVHATAGNRVASLDPATGQMRWIHHVGQRFAVSPRIDRGRVFVTSGDDIEALDLATGSLLWRRGDRTSRASDLAAAEGVVVQIDSRRGLLAVEASTGEEIWRVGGFRGSNGHSLRISDGVVMVHERSERIYAFELASGAARWVVPVRFGPGEAAAVEPVVEDGVVYTGGPDGRIYAIDATTGRVRWHYEEYGQIGGIKLLAVGAGVVYTAGFAFDADVRAVRPGRWAGYGAPSGMSRPEWPGAAAVASAGLHEPDPADRLVYFQELYAHLVSGMVADVRRFVEAEAEVAASYLATLAPLRQREILPARGHYTVKDDQLRRLWQMYALGRTSDYLLEVGTPPGSGAAAGRRFEGPYTAFLSGIGLTAFEHDQFFSPFHHEVVAVVSDDTAAEVTVEDVLWPGYWFGDLLFSRAGVRVRAPRHLIDPHVATTSTLYFTHRRDLRRTNDMSHGWGSNSQWGTSFSRFYADADGFHFNWDGRTDIGSDLPASSPHLDPATHERPLSRSRELLLHRCFVRSPLPHDEDSWFPYHSRMSVSASTWPLPEDSAVHPRWST